MHYATTPTCPSCQQYTPRYIHHQHTIQWPALMIRRHACGPMFGKNLTNILLGFQVAESRTTGL